MGLAEMKRRGGGERMEPKSKGELAYPLDILWKCCVPGIVMKIQEEVFTLFRMHKTRNGLPDFHLCAVRIASAPSVSSLPQLINPDIA